MHIISNNKLLFISFRLLQKGCHAQINIKHKILKYTICGASYILCKLYIYNSKGFYKGVVTYNSNLAWSLCNSHKVN